MDKFITSCSRLPQNKGVKARVVVLLDQKWGGKIHSMVVSKITLRTIWYKRNKMQQTLETCFTCFKISLFSGNSTKELYKKD